MTVTKPTTPVLILLQLIVMYTVLYCSYLLYTIDDQ